MNYKKLRGIIKGFSNRKRMKTLELLVISGLVFKTNRVILYLWS